MTSLRSSRRWLGRITAITALVGLTVAPSAAQALTVDITYDVTGETTIARTGGAIALGPTQLDAVFDFDTETFTGTLPLPETRTKFSAVGLLPVTADVRFIETQPVTGSLTASNVGLRVESTATYTVQLRNIKVLGLPTFAGERCQTKSPVTINVSAPPEAQFDLLDGGQLSGTYALGAFQNCGLNTALINLLVPGPNNPVTIDLSNGQLGDF